MTADKYQTKRRLIPHVQPTLIAHCCKLNGIAPDSAESVDYDVAPTSAVRNAADFRQN